MKYRVREVVRSATRSVFFVEKKCWFKWHPVKHESILPWIEERTKHESFDAAMAEVKALMSADQSNERCANGVSAEQLRGD